MVVDDPEEREALREVGLAALAVASIVLGLSRLASPDAPAPPWTKAFDVAVAALFAWDWGARTGRAPHRARYALLHSYELLAVVPWTLLPPGAAGGDVLRGLRLVRVARIGALARLSLTAVRLPRRLRRLRRIAGRAQLATIALVGVAFIAAGALALAYAERVTYGDALWWSLSLFSTVAYDVPPPSTQGGRWATGMLVWGGALFLGVFAASLASAILREPPADEG